MNGMNSESKGVPMNVLQAINERRAYRSLDPAAITEDIIRDLAQSTRLAPSCFNNQPWRFIFVHDPGILKEIKKALSRGNEWARAASMIIAVFSRKEDDCLIKSREYHQFDCGLATGFLLLRATELGLVAHPIAGYSPGKTKEILGIPEEYQVITLIIVGRHSGSVGPMLSEKQMEWEKSRPERLPFEKLAYIDKWGNALKEANS